MTGVTNNVNQINAKSFADLFKDKNNKSVSEPMADIINTINNYSNQKRGRENNVIIIIMKYETQIKDLETINNKTAYIENSISELKEIIEKAKNAEKFKEKDVFFKAYIDSFNKLKDESKNVQDNTVLTYDSVKGLLQSLKDGLNVIF
jgi:thymidylate synthase